MFIMFFNTAHIIIFVLFFRWCRALILLKRLVRCRFVRLYCSNKFIFDFILPSHVTVTQIENRVFILYRTDRSFYASSVQRHTYTWYKLKYKCINTCTLFNGRFVETLVILLYSRRDTRQGLSFFWQDILRDTCRSADPINIHNEYRVKRLDREIRYTRSFIQKIAPIQ